MAVYCHPACYMPSAGLDETQAGIRITRKNTSNLRYAGDTTLMAESEEKVKSLLMNVKEESEKLAENSKKRRSWHLVPSLSWQIDGETVGTVRDFIFLGSKITVDGDCSHEIKRRLLLGRKAMANLDSVFESRVITLLTKVGLVLPLVMYRCESWTVKKAEH